MQILEENLASLSLVLVHRCFCLLKPVVSSLCADLASNWLACFPLSARKHVYDVFFVHGLATEVVQTLVPCLQKSGGDDLDVKAIHSNTERYGIKGLLLSVG